VELQVGLSWEKHPRILERLWFNGTKPSVWSVQTHKAPLTAVAGLQRTASSDACLADPAGGKEALTTQRLPLRRFVWCRAEKCPSPSCHFLCGLVSQYLLEQWQCRVLGWQRTSQCLLTAERPEAVQNQARCVDKRRNGRQEKRRSLSRTVLASLRIGSVRVWSWAEWWTAAELVPGQTTPAYADGF
jgi:hypothetical protein